MTATSDWPTKGGRFRKLPVLVHADQNVSGEPITIQTLEGPVVAKPLAWIVTGVNGEQWPIQDDIFRKTYEWVPDEEYL